MKLFKKAHNKLNPFTENGEENTHNDEEEQRQQLENQYYKINKTFLIICQIFLSAPLGLQKPRKHPQKPGRDLIFYRLHVVWCSCVYSFLVFCVYVEYTWSNIKLPTVQKPLYFSEYLIYLLNLLEFIRMITFRREIFWKFQIFILDFDRTLIDMKVSVRYDDLQKFLTQHKALILLHLVICSIIGYFYTDCDVLNFLLTNTVYILPNVIINISLLQYYALLFIVYKRGDKLYLLLDTLLNTSCTDDIWKFRHQLNYIRSLYAKLDEFTKEINDHFSISICLVYLGSFINISVNIFLLYKYLNDWDKSTLSRAAYSLAWAFMPMAKMFLILYYNQKVQNMKNKANLLLSSFKFEYQAAERTLRLFILQLMSDTRSNYVCGMAALNMNCIISLSTGISTLFMFLVQYDITYEALTSTFNAGRPHQNK